MKNNKGGLGLTSAAFFYATIPLQFSMECFELKHSGQFAAYTVASFYEQMFPSEQNIVEFIAAFILSLMLFPLVCTIALIQTAPIMLAELAVGLLTLIPALAIAVAALPVVALLALGECLCDFFDIEQDYQETSAWSFSNSY